MTEEPMKPAEGPPEVQPAETRPALDEASASLAEALQTSFRVLTFLIILLLAFFLLGGFFTVQSDTKALILRFGRTDVDMVRDVGIHYAWPYPIDTVVSVPVKLRELEINTFWPETTESERARAVETGQSEAGPVAGAEGASMLTGDNNVLEARWNVTYRVPIVPTDDGLTPDQAVVDYYRNLGQGYQPLRTTANALGQQVQLPRETSEAVLMRMAVQSAVVRELGRVKVDDIYPKRMIDLSSLVKADVANTIKDLHVGLVVDQVNLITIRPPTDVKAAFDAVLEAEQAAVQEKVKAMQDKERTLIEAAGPVGVQLGDDIKAWWTAKAAGNTQELQKCDAEISNLFGKAAGTVATTISDAKAYKTKTIESARGDAAQVTYLATLLKTSPDEVKEFLNLTRVDALQDVLGDAYETFMYDPERDGKTRGTLELWINRRPELLRELTNIPETR